MRRACSGGASHEWIYVLENNGRDSCTSSVGALLEERVTLLGPVNCMTLAYDTMIRIRVCMSFRSGP